MIRNDEAGYCLKQCYKMCFYISQLHHFEILRMRAEFIKDIHGTIWFTYAANVWMRPNNAAQEVRDNQEKAKLENNKRQREMLMKQLQDHLEESPKHRAGVERLEAKMAE